MVVICSCSVIAQTKKVLFLGNSYTHGNNMPAMLSNAAVSTGKNLIYDMYAPGGYYTHNHLNDSTSLAKIASGSWDNVVVQDQSMSMAYPNRHIGWMPYYVKIDSIIKSNNICVQTMLFSTWGRKNGDTYFCTPPQCETETWINRTYYQVDSAIETNYKIISDSLKSSLTPVGAVWRYLRLNYPEINLFEPDDSHPTLAGSYAAACSFYATIFRSDPTLITFDAGLTATFAERIRLAAKNVVYNHLIDWNIGLYNDDLDYTCFNLGKDKNNYEKYWKIAPNPVDDVLSVILSPKNATDKISIYNVLGILIKEIEVYQSAIINFTTFPNGLYLIKSQMNHTTIKILKK